MLVSILILLVACSSDSGSDKNVTTENQNGENSEQVTLKYGHYFPIDDLQGQVAEKWASLVEEKSDGSIEVEIYPNEQLVKGKEGFQSTANGIVDLYPVLTPYIGGQIPLVSAFDFPFPPASYTDEVLAEFVDEANPLIEEEMTRNGLKSLGAIASTGSTSIYSTKPVRSMEDLKGLKIRGPGGLADEALSLLGASVTFLSASEQYMALQTGTVDGVGTTYTSFDSLNLHEVAPYWTNIDVIRSPYFLIMNNAVWESLSESQQDILIEATEEAREWGFNEAAEIEKELADTARENVEEEIELSDEELEKWIDEMEPLFDHYLEENGEKGKEFLEIYEKYR